MIGARLRNAHDINSELEKVRGTDVMAAFGGCHNGAVQSRLASLQSEGNTTNNNLSSDVNTRPLS